LLNFLRCRIIPIYPVWVISGLVARKPVVPVVVPEATIENGRANDRTRCSRHRHAGGGCPPHYRRGRRRTPHTVETLMGRRPGAKRRAASHCAASGSELTLGSQASDRSIHEAIDLVVRFSQRMGLVRRHRTTGTQGWIDQTGCLAIGRYPARTTTDSKQGECLDRFGSY
jgi:hypothetical protein